ncbi:hypothetical protein LOTGIDRAFT_155461 [Lottia gigantea]|uniref:Uncharacterized protein n=1 Tax=Lottia gigantea TaxID=225164 RepID=V3ZTA8_LOTGI|nr:hypothetical protein LOTGIDRAFT_155461 [Lottia gigantea]ESO84136.1 hypothetical protein LOTGIDRAFT_155461 [Lottia gigantea]
MSQIVTGFLGAKPGDGPYFSPRFRVTQKNNARKYYRKKKSETILEIDDYLTHIDMTDNTEFDIDDILSPRYTEFGFVKAYKARLRRRGLDPKQLFCVNRHSAVENPRSCLTSLPKLKKKFLVQQSSDMGSDFSKTPRVEDEFTQSDFKKSNPAEKMAINPSDLDQRLKTLEEHSSVDGFIVRGRKSGRPLGNITSSDYLQSILQQVEEANNNRRSSIFYRTEVTNT